MPEPPLISIVTPSYNQAPFLERTIRSVLDQDYSNLDYIIIDGGSTDGSVEIIRKYQDRLAYWVSEPDRGQAHAIRKGFERSHGDVLAYLNSDDIYLPGAISKVMEAFASHPDADLIFGNVYLIDAQDQKVGELRFTPFDLATLIFEGGNLHQSGAFWRREIYQRVRGIDPRYRFCMDFDFFCRVAEVGRLLHLRQHLASFRVHPAAKSSQILDVGRHEHERIQGRYSPDDLGPTELWWRRTRCQARRFFWYLAQGDLDYALKGLVKRIPGGGRR